MAPSKAKRHNTHSVIGAAGNKLTVNLKNNLAKNKTKKAVTGKQASKKVGKSVTKSAPYPHGNTCLEQRGKGIAG